MEKQTCFLWRFQLFFLLTQAHFQIFTVFKVFRHSFGRILKSDTTFAYLPQNSTGFLPSLLTKNSAAAAASSSFFRGTEEPLPSFLRSLRLANRLATFLAARLSPWSSNQRFLLATKWSIFSFVLKFRKCCCLSFLHASQKTSDKLLSLLNQAEARRFHPGTSPLPQLPFFPEHSRYSVVPPDPLATGLHPSKKAKSAVA